MRFSSRSSIIRGDQVGYSNGGRTINYILQLRSYDFKEAFLVLWIKDKAFHAGKNCSF